MAQRYHSIRLSFYSIEIYISIYSDGSKENSNNEKLCSQKKAHMRNKKEIKKDINKLNVYIYFKSKKYGM